MLKKINKLILFSKNENNEIHNKLVSIAAKVEKRLSSGKTYLLIDTREMESLVSPNSVDKEEGVGEMGLEL
ncbi:hypothetical protein CMI47_03115 [Candidatus Pacearchaeota archaeon]|nr:hypothetical protein [Candidatus Pacearchaeota archaeon]|tara:strand:+ start:1498 stop:1710 length:213 start_codon:yes stop_codon:yes gene_type:complete